MQQGVVLNLELKQSVARRQVDFVSVARVPSGNDQPTRIGIALDFGDQVRNLIDSIARGVAAAKRTPEITINRFYEIPKNDQIPFT